MARHGLGLGWRCLFANDFDAKKAASYRANWGGDELVVADVASLTPAHLPGAADLAWASFPCQDVSLAGARRGVGDNHVGDNHVGDNHGDEAVVARTRSGAFWPVWRLMRGLGGQGRAPRLIALENVTGVFTSNGGRDFAAIVAAFAQAGYRCGALAVDAARFTPQSRPRAFIFGVRADMPVAAALVADSPASAWTTKALTAAHAGLSAAERAAWLWWRLPEPPPRQTRFIDIIEDQPADAPWRDPAHVAALLDMMAPAHRARLDAALASGERAAAGVYKRIRVEQGRRVQRAEARFDGLAGCLRTPSGGSSRQTVLLVEGGRMRARLLSAREAARLMGLPDSYILPQRYNDAYHLAGDGVAPPGGDWLARPVFEPGLDAAA